MRPFYIGIGKSEKRAYQRNHHRSNYWKNIAAKGYRVDIIFDDLTWEEACNKEKELISLYGRNNLSEDGLLCNLTDGGDGGFGVVVREDTKEKIRQYQLSLNKKGQPGRQQSDETKEKIRQTLKGTTRPEEVKEKMRKPRSNKANYSYPKSAISCPYCGKEAQPALAYRWHFENCKHKLIN